MQVELTSGYIGNVDGWRNVMNKLIHNTSKLENILYFNLDYVQILRNYWQTLSTQTFFELPLSNVELPLSYQHLWQSGLIFFFDKLCALLLERDTPVSFALQDVEDLQTFIHPRNFVALRDFQQRNLLTLDPSMVIEQGDFVFNELDENNEDYFDYPFLDSVLSLPALTHETLLNGYVIADGEIEYGGQLVFMYSDIVFKDKEMEIVNYNPHTGTNRYKSFAEFFTVNCLSHFVTIEETRNIKNYFQIDKEFEMIFASDVQYTLEGYFTDS